MDIQQHINLVKQFQKDRPNKEVLDSRKTYYTSDFVEWLYEQLTIPVVGVPKAKQLPKCKHKNIISSDGLDECLDCGVRNY